MLRKSFLLCLISLGPASSAPALVSPTPTATASSMPVPTPGVDELVYDGEQATLWTPDQPLDTTGEDHTPAGAQSLGFSNGIAAPNRIQFSGPLRQRADFDSLDFWVFATSPYLTLNISLNGDIYNSYYYEPLAYGGWQVGAWNHVVIPLAEMDAIYSGPFSTIDIQSNDVGLPAFYIDDIHLVKGAIPTWVTTATPVPTSVPGAACGQPLSAVVLPGRPRVFLYGNLDACTPANALCDYGPLGAPNGYVPDRSVDFVITDSAGNTHALRASFAKTSIDDYYTTWHLDLNEVSNGATPNGDDWTEGGPGNLVDVWDLSFDPQGRLVDAGNGGPAYDEALPLASDPAFHFSLKAGDDMAALPANAGYRVGLTADACCVLPTMTPTDSPVETLTPSFSMTATPTSAVGSTTASPSPSRTVTVAYDETPTSTLSGTPGTATASMTRTATPTATPGSSTASPTFSVTPSITVTMTPSPTKTDVCASGCTATVTSSATATGTACTCTVTDTPTISPTRTVTATSDPSLTPSISPTATPGSSTASPTLTDTGSPTVFLTATSTATACIACGSPTETMTMTPVVTDTAVVPAMVPTMASSASSSVSVVPAANPAAPSPSSPLAFYYPIGAGNQTPNAKLLIFSTAGALVTAQACQICDGPTLTFSWDGSGAASGLYYAAVDLGDGIVRGQFPLMVLP